MVEIELQVEPENMLQLESDEVYAGISKCEWDMIVNRLNFFEPVELDDIEPEDQACDVCRQSFRPSIDGASPEKPVRLPCNHVFGKDCISEWIAVSPEPCFEHRNWDEEGEEEEEEEADDRFRSCPKCRKRLRVQMPSGEQAAVIEARIHFWDFAYKKLGIVLSIEEEECRQGLWRYEEEMKVGQPAPHWRRISTFELSAQISAMRFAMRRGRCELTPLQRYFRDGLFNLGCHGPNLSGNYNAHWFEERELPFWCWHLERVEQGLDPAYDWDEERKTPTVCGRWLQERLGPWRRAMFALEDDRVVWGSEEWLLKIWYEGAMSRLSNRNSSDSE